MKDLWHSITTFVDYNRFVVLGLLVAVLAAGAFLGCQPRTDSLIVPGTRITATQLDQEVAAINQTLQTKAAKIEADQSALAAEETAIQAKVNAAGEDLAQQVEIRKAVVNTLATVAVDAANGTVTPAGAIQGIVSLLLMGATAGLAADNLRKSRVISAQKNAAATVTTNAGT